MVILARISSFFISSFFILRFLYDRNYIIPLYTALLYFNAAYQHINSIKEKVTKILLYFEVACLEELVIILIYGC